MWKLWITEADRKRREVDLPQGIATLIGRSSKSDIRIHSAKVSRRQLTLRPAAGGVELVVDETASAQPTIGDRPIERNTPVQLQNGAIIRIAEVLLQIVAQDEAGTRDEIPETCSVDRTPSMRGIPELTGNTQGSPVVSKSHITLNEQATSPAREALPYTLSPQTNVGTSATRFAAESHTNLPIGDEPDKTTFLPEDEARRVLKQHATRRRKVLLAWGLGLLAAMVVLPWFLVDNDNSRPKLDVHKGTFFSLNVRPQWRARSIGDVLVFSRGRGSREGVAVFRRTDDAILTYDYHRAFHDAATRWTMAVKDADETVWDDWSNYSLMPVIHRDGETGIFFVGRQGRRGDRGSALLRIYLCRNQYVAVGAWSLDRPIPRDMYEILDSVYIDLTVIEPDFVRRDIRWNAVDFHRDNIVGRLKEAEYLFVQRQAAPGNAWRAYDKTIDVLRLYGNVSALDSADNYIVPVRDLWDRYLLPYAEYIELEYRHRMISMMAAVASGDHARVERLADEIKAIIPDPQDPRWIWAQGEGATARSKSSSRRGFL